MTFGWPPVIVLRFESREVRTHSLEELRYEPSQCPIRIRLLNEHDEGEQENKDHESYQDKAKCVSEYPHLKLLKPSDEIAPLVTRSLRQPKRHPSGFIRVRQVPFDSSPDETDRRCISNSRLVSQFDGDLADL